MVQWLRLQIKMEWFPHPFQTYPRTLRSFTCCGWAVDTSLHHYFHTCWPQFWELTEILAHHTLVTTNIMVQWLRLQIHMGWFPHPFFQKYPRCLRLLACYGRASESIIAPLLPNLLSQISGVDEDIGSHLGNNQCHGAVVEVKIP